MEVNKDNTFFTGRLKSIGFAVKGAIKLVTTEHSVMVQSSIAVLMTVAGFYYNITATEWMFQILVFGLVLSIEGLNTAVEKIADFILHQLERSGSALKSRSLYLNREGEIIITVIHRKQLAELKDFIKKTDPGAFVIVNDTYEVLGKGFKTNQAI